MPILQIGFSPESADRAPLPSRRPNRMMSISPLHALRRQLSAIIARTLSPRGVIVSGLVLIVFGWTLCAAALIEARQDAYDHAVENARNLMLLIERDIARNIELYDLSLQNVVDGLADRETMALPAHLRDQVLFDRAATGEYLGSIFVLDARGDIVIDSGANPPRRVNVADRDYFRIHRDGRSHGLYISRPYASRLRHGALTIALSRRIERPDGSFGGIVVGTLSIDFFRALLDGIAVGKQGTAAILEDNGTVVCRLPFDPLMIGRDVSDSPLFVKSNAQRDGVLDGAATIDGVRRIYVYRHLANLPLSVDVAPAESDVYGPWQIRAAWFVTLMDVFSTIILTGSLLLSRELRRRQLAESQLYRLAHTDALTGLDNRGRFDTVIAKEVRRANRSGRPVSMLFVDVDHFKAYNDYYGHPAGDDVLRAVAQRASRCLQRPSDHVARYGGEEFVVTLPDTDARGAANIAETIRQAIAELGIAHARSPYSHVTVSIGVATCDGHSTIEASTLVKRADDALYRAKSNGRNRICENAERQESTA
jgi:diguanylate cyclase (GGDEF)-like protein